MTIIKTLDQLPLTPPSRLFGRTDVFRELTQHLSEDQAICVHGIDGMGKHALALTFAANRVQSWQPTLWLRVWQEGLDHLLWQMLRAYEQPIIGDIRQTAQNLLSEQNPLIILEVKAFPHLAAQFIQEISQGRAAVMALHSTPLSLNQGINLYLNRLNDDSSYQLFTTWAGFNHNAKDVASLIGYLNGHPLSLRLAAHCLRQMTAANLYLRMPLGKADPAQRALQITDTLFRFLDKSAQGLLLAIAANFTEGMSLELLQRLVGNQAETLIQPLLQSGFVTVTTRAGIPYYDLPALIQIFARDQLTQNGMLAEAQNRLITATINFTKRYANPTADFTALWLDMENVLQVAWHCLNQQQLEPFQQLIHNLSAVELFGQGWSYQAELHQLRERAGLLQTRPSTPPPDNLPELEKLALEPISAEDTVSLAATVVTPPVKVDSPSTALVPVTTTALTTQHQNLLLWLSDATTRQDRPEMARLTMLLADHHLEQGEITLAINLWEQAVQLYQSVGDLTHLLTALELLTSYILDYRTPEEALDHARRGLNIARQLDNTSSRCRFMSLLADIFHAVGDNKNALESFKRAIKLSRMIADDEQTGIMLTKLAAIYMDEERYREATVALSQAISLFEAIGRRDLLGRALGNLGTALGNLGRWHEAGQRHAAALRIARQLNDTEEERFQLGNLAYVAEVEGHIQWAINYHRQALYVALLEEDDAAVTDLSYDLARLLMAEPEWTPQAVVMIETILQHQPSAEVKRWLKETKARLKQRERAGMVLEPAEPDLVVYAGEVYPLKS